MRDRRMPLAASAVAMLLVAACGGSASPTQPAGGTTAPGVTTAPGATSADGGAATQAAPTDQQAGGGGGGGSKPPGWDQFGKVHVDMAGPVSKSADYGFVPAGSLFGGSQGTSLNFTIDGSNEVVSILIAADGKVIVSYGGEDFSMPGATCTTSNWNIGVTSGSGSFDCTATITILASGASVQGGTMRGTFDAHG